MAAMVLVHTAYEGFANDLIERVFPEVWAVERTQFVGAYRGTLGKTMFLAEQLGVKLNRGSRPYRSVAELHAWRNDLVHPQTVRVKGTIRFGGHPPQRSEGTASFAMAFSGVLGHGGASLKE